MLADDNMVLGISNRHAGSQHLPDQGTRRLPCTYELLDGRNSLSLCLFCLLVSALLPSPEARRPWSGVLELGKVKLKEGVGLETSPYPDLMQCR